MLWTRAVLLAAAAAAIEGAFAFIQPPPSHASTPLMPRLSTLRASTTRSPYRGGSTLTMAAGAEGDHDVIVVGGGIGGCILANRLTETGKKNVLLLEAGKPSFNNYKVNIPAGVIRLFKSELDWQYVSEPEKDLDGKQVYLIRGKTLGGSSALNVMLVHRGTASDYQKWERSGATGWGPSDVIEYFKKAEANHVDEDTRYHNKDGLYDVEDVRYQNPLSAKFLEACDQFGMSPNTDFNDWSRDQVGYGRFRVSQKKGSRWTAAKGYLKKALKRKNLDVVTQAYVTKVVMEGTRAVGVEYVDSQGQKQIAKVSPGGEVVLAGGAINSPQVLQLSGIGDAQQLQSVGITPVVDRPGVGQNLQDHPAVVIAHNITQSVALTDVLFQKGSGSMKLLPVLKWLFRRSGPLTTPGCDHGAFVKTRSDIPEADLQMRFVAGRATDPDGVRSYIEIGAGGQPVSGLTLQLVGIRAQSKGTVSLRSSDPFQPPKIECKYLSEAEDLQTLRNGIQLARELVKQDAFKDVLGPEVFPGADVQTADQLDAYIRDSLHTANALVGTCRMGSPADPSAVVDTDLKVIGTQGLRVVDASVFPTIPGGQTGAPTTMVAERAAELIRVALGDFADAPAESSGGVKGFFSKIFGRKTPAAAAA